MAPPLMNLPAYQTPNALLNFAPVSDGIDSYRKGQEDVRRFGVAQDVGRQMADKNYSGAAANALMGDRADLAGVAMHAQTNDQQARLNEFKLAREKIDAVGRMAQAAISETDPRKKEAMRQHIISQHPDKELLSKFPIYGTDQGLTLIAAESGHALNKLDEDLKRAQINRLNAQAGAQSALANVRDGRAGPEAPSPLAGWGEDAEGNLVPPRGPSIPQSRRPQNPLYDGAKAPDSVPEDVAPAAAPPGGAGRFAPNFTRIADKRTQSEDAQDVGGYADDAAQQRLMASMARRKALEAAYGKAPSGKAWNEQGGLVDLSVKDTATERAMRMHASAGLNTLKTAESLLEKTGTLDQLAGSEVNVPGVGKIGGFGEAGRGFKAARSAVLQLNFALSGKSVSNAEREEFQSIYMPSPFDSRETQRFKIKQVREFFNTVLDARKKGMDDDKIAELYRQSIAEGTKGQPPADPAQPSGPVRVNSPQEAAALKPGTRFIGHDGQERVRQ